MCFLGVADPAGAGGSEDRSVRGVISGGESLLCAEDECRFTRDVGVNYPGEARQASPARP